MAQFRSLPEAAPLCGVPIITPVETESEDEVLIGILVMAAAILGEDIQVSIVSESLVAEVVMGVVLP